MDSGWEGLSGDHAQSTTTREVAKMEGPNATQECDTNTYRYFLISLGFLVSL